LFKYPFGGAARGHSPGPGWFGRPAPILDFEAALREGQQTVEARIKVRNPASIAVRRERSERWNR
jgi:hypothetical protein